MGGGLEPMIFPTAEAKRIQQRLYLLVVAHLVVSILVIAGYSFSMGLSLLINTLILWCGAYQLQYCSVLFFILLSMVDSIQALTIIGIRLQNGETYWFTENAFATVALVLYLPVAIFGIYLAFGAYKEYKALFFEQAGAGGGGREQPFLAPGGADENRGGNVADPRAGQHNAGPGYRAYQPPRYDAPEQRNQRPPQQPQDQRLSQRSGGSSGGNYQAFRGQGVRLGGS